MLFSILILALAFISLVILMIIHEFGHFIIAKKFGVRVDEFGIGYPPRLFGKKIGETMYSVNLIPLGAFVRIYGEEGGIEDYRSFSNLKIWKRILIIIGGVVAFWITAAIIFSIVFAIGAEVPIGDQDVAGIESTKVRIMMVSAGSPAELAGLKTKDTIKSVKVESSFTEINKIVDFQNVISENKGKELTLVVLRNGKEMNINLSPRIDPPSGEGPIGIGLVRTASLIEKNPIYLAPIKGIAYTWETTVKSLAGFYNFFGSLFSRQGLPEGAALAGPLGITVFLANAATYGPGFFLYFIGIISVLVAIFNILPIPALDGGKLVFLLIEKIKGKPVSPKIEATLTVIFFSLLIMMSLYVTIMFDIPRVASFFKTN